MDIKNGMTLLERIAGTAEINSKIREAEKKRIAEALEIPEDELNESRKRNPGLRRNRSRMSAEELRRTSTEELLKKMKV